MKSGGKGGSILSKLGGIILSLAIIGVVLAALSMLGVSSVKDGVNVAKEKALNYIDCIPKGTCGLPAVLDDIDLDASKLDDLIVGKDGTPEQVQEKKEKIFSQIEGYKGPEKGEPFVISNAMVKKEETSTALSKLKVVKDDSKDVGYERKEWKHWSSVGKNSCWNTREDILYRDSVPGSVKLVDNDKNKVETLKEACAIGKPMKKDDKVIIETENVGKWIDPYSGETIKDSSKLDIDHIIPLSKAARSGGQDWDKEQKEKFANDPENLLAVSAKENRSKSDKGPGEYMPKNKSYHCQYAKSYISVASKYKLTINKDDAKALEKALSSCPI